MKKWFLCFLSVALLLGLVRISADAEAPLVVDDGELLTASEEAALEQELELLGDELEMDVVVVTTDSLDGRSAMAYADDYYDDNGYAADGVLLLVSMSEREWWISTSGDAIYRISSRDIDRIGEDIVPYLSSGAYGDAFGCFANGVRICTQVGSDDTAVDAVGDEIYPDIIIEYDDIKDLPDQNADPGNGLTAILVCVVIGILVAFVAVFVMKNQLRSIHAQRDAGSYVVNGSFALTERHELFLFSNVTRREKPKNNSSGGIHVGSSGRSHGGGGGRF